MIPVMSDRPRHVQRARLLSIISVVWGGIAAAIAIATGIGGGSLSLIGFGADSAIDAAASVALVWRFHVESSDPDRALRVEHAAERVVGVVLVVAGLSLILGAGRALLAHAAVHSGLPEIVLLVASLVALPPLAIAKRRTAARIDSKALANDALLTAAAALLALVALLAAFVSSSGELWWADAVGSVVIAAVLVREGWASVGWARRDGEGKSRETTEQA
jgi:divalent metal cation (Fe/Co/Zn/Cd) transporter